MPQFPVLLGDLSCPLAPVEGWSSPSLMPQLVLTTDHRKLRPSWATLSPKKIRENTKHEYFGKENNKKKLSNCKIFSVPLTTELPKHLI